MKKYDPTKSLKQMFHKPNVVPFYNIMLIFVILFIAMPVHWSLFSHSNIMDIASANNAHYEPRDSELLTILIDKNGKIRIGFSMINDISNLSDVIEDSIECLSPDIKNKILLKVDRRTKFGKVQEVLKAAKKADVKVVGLITLECVPLVHFFKPIKK